MEIENEILKWMHEQLGLAPFATDGALADVPGWDSLRHAQFIIELQRRYKVRFAVSELLSIVNIQQAAELIRSKSAGTNSR